MSQFRSFAILFAGAIMAAACTTPTSPPQTTSTVEVTPPSSTETAPPADPPGQPVADPAGQPVADPGPPVADPGKPVTEPGKPPVARDAQDPATAPGFVACTNPRKNICTKEYKPVCGVVDTGIRCIRAPCPSTAEQTFGNACSACAEAKTSGYRAGACATPAPPGPEVK